MLIVCPSCASEYAIDPARIGPQGRSVRCARCRDSWFVAPAGAVEPAAEPETPPLQTEARSGRSEPEAAPALAVGRGGARRARPAPGGLARASRRLRPLGAGLLLVLVIGLAVGAVIGRSGVVRALPSTARLYERIGLAVNLRGLEFRGVGAELAAGQGSGSPSLVVEGEVANVAGHPVPVPPVEIVVRERAGAPPLYTWTTLASQDTLGPGEAARFRAKLVEPPAEGREVAVRFAPPPDRSTWAARAP